jgi:hypothetical protein
LDSRMREDIVDRGIEKGEWEMRNLSKQLHHEESNQNEESNQRSSGERQVGPVGEHNSGQMSAEASDQIGTTPVASSQDEGSSRRGVSEDDVRNRKVDPEAVRESFKEAELDPIAENEPEEGEKAA